MTTQANQSEFDRWNGERGKGWVDDADHRDVALAPVAAALLAAAQLAPGELVLDIGCGCGATTLAAASAVEPDGAVLGVDLSDTMLAVARARLAESPRSNVTLLQADAQTHPPPAAAHDVAISRFGTMFFDDPVAAFTNIAQSLRAGGRLCLATWQPVEANEWLTRPLAPLFSGQPPSTPVGPGMFGQSDPDRAGAVLRDAGFGDVVVRPHTIAMLLGADAGKAGRYVASTSVGQQLLAELDDAARAAAIDAVIDAVRPSETADGVRLDGGIFIITASVHR